MEEDLWGQFTPGFPGIILLPCGMGMGWFSAQPSNIALGRPSWHAYSPHWIFRISNSLHVVTVPRDYYMIQPHHEGSNWSTCEPCTHQKMLLLLDIFQKHAPILLLFFLSKPLERGVHRSTYVCSPQQFSPSKQQHL